MLYVILMRQLNRGIDPSYLYDLQTTVGKYNQQNQAVLCGKIGLVFKRILDHDECDCTSGVE